MRPSPKSPSHQITQLIVFFKPNNYSASAIHKQSIPLLSLGLDLKPLYSRHWIGQLFYDRHVSHPRSACYYYREAVGQYLLTPTRTCDTGLDSRKNELKNRESTVGGFLTLNPKFCVLSFSLVGKPEKFLQVVKVPSLPWHELMKQLQNTLQKG